LAFALGLAVRPALLTDIITLGFGIGADGLIGFATVSVAGIQIRPRNDGRRRRRRNGPIVGTTLRRPDAEARAGIFVSMATSQ
jgi:hypothetical protein